MEAVQAEIMEKLGLPPRKPHDAVSGNSVSGHTGSGHMGSGHTVPSNTGPGTVNDAPEPRGA